ncbi:MAG: FG-GAP-like repeat-containing protein [Ignavibacteria bacterium]
MKKPLIPIYTVFSIALLFLFTSHVNANWPISERKNSTLQSGQSAILNDQNIENKSSGKSVSDSLPEGVSRDWLNSLKDENGNRIIPNTENEQNNQTSRVNENPEGDAFQRKIFNGQSLNSHFGFSVNSAGDVNADGFDDIVIGAYAYISNTGKAYLFFGGSNMNTVPDLVLTGVSTNNFLGWSVASAGDLNADGYGDFVFGSDGYNLDQGRVYVFLGGALINNTPDLVITGEAIGNRFGSSVRNAGDVNGDGFTDLIIGALGYSSSKGRAYIYYGGINPDTIADKKITGESTFNFFGTSVSSAGDFNGDGFGDFIIGASGFSSNSGRSYLYYGNATPDTIADLIMTGTSGSYFGHSVASAGDVNGDGFSDIITGAYGFSSLTGRAYIFYGGVSSDNLADVTFDAEAAGNYFGISTSSAGDLNGDGFDDVVIGASRYLTSIGRVYVYFGGALMNNIPDAVMTGETTSNFFGISVASAGDINGDGYPELLVGASGFSSNKGRVYLYDYFMKNDLTYDLVMTGATASDIFGTSVSNAGDVNGDGYSDVIVGAPSNDAGGSDAGRAYIYLGGVMMDNVPDVIMTGDSANNNFGYFVSDAGDVNGDGYSDVILGAFGNRDYTGKAYVFLGGPIMNNTADVIMSGEAIGDNFGWSVSSADDVNGDGFSDVIVGAYNNDGGGTNFGRAYVYFGGITMNNTADVILTGSAFSDQFGYSVSSAGDVNGDGYSDLIIGAPYNDAGGSNAGQAYVYFGGVSIDINVDVYLTGVAASEQFGFSVSSTGDVNRDGYSDVIVGAPYSNAGGSNAGRACVYFGGSSMNNTADVIMTGEAVNSKLGNAVSTAGDMNGDGYADVLVGAIYFDAAIGWVAGRAYVYHGGISMNNSADLTMTGEAEFDNLGNSVSSAGDVNSDGYNDLIVGAFLNDAGGFEAGRAYIYQGSAISTKPILNYVKDVYNDQGGKLNLKWSRSGMDVNGNSVITDYLVQRSYPPSGGSFSWENLTVIPASHESFYTYTDYTPSDSSVNGNGTMYYRITARTSNINQYYRSGILFGRSIDNIAPLMVSPFTASPILNNVNLTWNRSTASDLLNYVLYRSVNPTIDPNTEPVFATTADSTYLDTTPLSGAYYYFIVAQDIHNNKSPVATASSPSVTLNMTMFIEGFYNAGSDSQVSDTVRAFLRNTSSPFAIVDSAKVVVSSAGSVNFVFGNAPTGTYYIMIKHRNSIETWSKTGGELLTSGISNSYNFSNASSKAYGNNLQQVDSSPVRFAIYSGDVNQDGVVDLTDGGLITNDAFNFESGHLATDLNGDGVVDVADAVFADNNGFNFVGKITP